MQPPSGPGLVPGGPDSLPPPGSEPLLGSSAVVSLPVSSASHGASTSSEHKVSPCDRHLKVAAQGFATSRVAAPV